MNRIYEQVLMKNLEAKGGRENFPPLTEAERAELRLIRDKYHQIRSAKEGRDGFDLNDIYPDEHHLDTLYAQLTDLKKCLDSFRPLNEAQMRRLNEAFDVEYTYNSNRIEGNTLTLGETSLVVNKGLTIAGKSLREHLEAINHHEAIIFIRDLASKGEDFNERILKEVHALVLRAIDRDNAGRYRSVPVTIAGSRYMPPQPYLIVPKMEDCFLFYNANKHTLHPVALAAHMHEKLVTIHPFIDGSGRTARLVMNFILLRNGYPVAIISSDQAARYEYYTTLEKSQRSGTGDNHAFLKFIAECVKIWLIKYLELISGDISAEAAERGYYFFKKIEPLLEASGTLSGKKRPGR